MNYRIGVPMGHFVRKMAGALRPLWVVWLVARVYERIQHRIFLTGRSCSLQVKGSTIPIGNLEIFLALHVIFEITLVYFINFTW